MNLYFGSLIYTRESDGTLRGVVAENDFLSPDWKGRLGTETATPREVPDGDIAGVYCSSTYLPDGTDVFTGPLRILRIGSLYSLHWTKPGASPFFGVGFRSPDDPARYYFGFYGAVMAPYWVPNIPDPEVAGEAPGRSREGGGNLALSFGVACWERAADGSFGGPVATNDLLEPGGGRPGEDLAEPLGASGEGLSGRYRATRRHPDGEVAYRGVLEVGRTGDMVGLHWARPGDAPLLGVGFEDPARPGRYVVGTWGMRLSAFWNPPPDLDCAGHSASR